MKKKLKIYSTLFVVALIVLLVAHKVRFEGYTWYQGGKDTLMFVDNAPEFYTSDTTYHEGGQGVHTIYHPTMSYNVYVRPKMPRDNQTLISRSKWLGSEKPEMQTYRVTMQKVRLETPVKEEGFFINFPIIEAIVSGVLTAVVTIWILCLVFKLVRRIHRGGGLLGRIHGLGPVLQRQDGARACFRSRSRNQRSVGVKLTGRCTWTHPRIGCNRRSRRASERPFP